MILTNELHDEYVRMFDSLTIRPEHIREVNSVVDHLLQFRKQYEEVAALTGVPWYVIAVIDEIEASGGCHRHLFNGDPLTARTKHDPVNQPAKGQPPFLWKESAIAALAFDHLTGWTDWSVPGTLFKLEGYNGWGYRMRGFKSAYLWSFSTAYSKGFFTSDHGFSASAVSDECGTAVLLHRLLERKIITLEA